MSHPEDYPSDEDVKAAGRLVCDCTRMTLAASGDGLLDALNHPTIAKLVIDAAWRIMRNRTMREERARWDAENERKGMPFEADTMSHEELPYGIAPAVRFENPMRGAPSRCRRCGSTEHITCGAS